MPLQRSILVAVICALISPVSGVGAQYFLLNYAPDGLDSGKRIGSSALMNYVSETFGTGNRRSPLKVGVSCLYYPCAAKGGSRAEVALMRKDLALAERLNVPILVQVDVDNWLPASLVNWYNPSAAGYNPAKRADVEWYASGYCYGEFNLFPTNYGTWSSWLTSALLNDTNCIYQARYNFDSARGKPSVERALRDARGIAASKDKSPANSGSL